MKKVLTLFISCCIIQFSYAQDSTWTNLGRTQLRNGSFQSVTVKGTDLERIPAVSLQQAINTWLYGTLSMPFTITYVVDGSIVTDVNIYGIRDIEEVTMVQNPAIMLNGAYHQQQMVLITTKKRQTAGSSITVAGHSALVTEKEYYYLSDKLEKGDNGLFHQYNISANRKTNSINSGVSFNFLRDVMNYVNPFVQEKTPNDFRRYSVNSFLDWNINRHHQLSTRLNLLQQPDDYSSTSIYSNGTNSGAGDGSQKILQTEIALKSNLKSGFTNTFSLGYSGSTSESDWNQAFTSTIQPSSSSSSGDFENNTDNLLLYNTTRWSGKKGNWQFSPAINASYRWLKKFVEEGYTDQWGTRLTTSSSNIKKLLITPSVDFAFKNVLNFQVGVLFDFLDSTDKKEYPYSLLSIDIPSLTGWQTNAKWKIFASYATARYLYDDVATLRDFSMTMYPYNFYENYFSTSPIPHQVSRVDYYNWQLGTTLGLLKDRVTFSYNFERRNYISHADVSTPQFIYPTFPETNSTTHDIRVSMKSVEAAKTKWFSTIHATSIANEDDLNSQNANIWRSNVGSNNGEKRSWSTGWNNSIQSGPLVFGLNLMYEFNHTEMVTSEPEESNLFSVHSVYAGIKFNLKKKEDAEVYLTSKNPFQNKSHIQFMDGRSYFGAGFKLAL